MTSPPERRAELIGLYKLAIEEYRFNVQLNWDRTKHYMLLDSALLAAVAGLVKLGSDGTGAIFIVALLALGFFIALLGLLTVREGHEYYRAAAVKKTVIERELGYLEAIREEASPLLTLAIGTTRGMREPGEMLRDPEAWLARPVRPVSIVSFSRLVFATFAVLNAAGAMTILASLAR